MFFVLEEMFIHLVLIKPNNVESFLIWLYNLGLTLSFWKKFKKAKFNKK